MNSKRGFDFFFLLLFYFRHESIRLGGGKQGSDVTRHVIAVWNLSFRMRRKTVSMLVLRYFAAEPCPHLFTKTF